MPIKCYTCGKPIKFDDKHVAPSGKKIPMNLDDSDHSHGDFNPTAAKQQQPSSSNLLTSSLSQVGQIQRTGTATTSSSQSQGGSYLDTKRIRVMLEELTNEVRELEEIVANELRQLKEIFNSRTILDTNRYEGKNDQIYNVIAPFLNTQGVVASELLREKQQNLDTTMINHAKKADAHNIADESKHIVTESLRDDEDDEMLGALTEGEGEGVIKEE